MGRARGVTLIEILITVTVLAILAAVVAPRFSRASNDPRIEALRTNLLDVRAQLRLYQSQHGSRFPSLRDFALQMTTYSDAEGHTTQARTKKCNLGPYLPSIPLNPYTGGNRIGIGTAGSSDWFYDEATGAFRANQDPAFVQY